MALIKCPECGREISNQSATCIHCGYPINVNKEPEENAAAGESGEENNPRAEGKRKGRKKKVVLLIIGILVIAIAIVVAVISRTWKTETINLYVEIPWGTSRDETIKILSESDIVDTVIKYSDHDESDNTVAYIVNDYDGHEGIDAMCAYEFNDDGSSLNNVTVLVILDNDDMDEDEAEEYVNEIYEDYKERLTDAYGAYEEDSFSLIWTTSTETISLVNVSDEMFAIDVEGFIE